MTLVKTKNSFFLLDVRLSTLVVEIPGCLISMEDNPLSYYQGVVIYIETMVIIFIFIAYCVPT